MKKEVIFGERTKKVLGVPPTPISWGVKTGNIIWLAGVAACDKQWNVIGKTAGEQFEKILQITQAILKDAGASLDDIVKMTKYFTEEFTMDKVYPAVAEVTKRYFKKGYYPPSTGVQVESLMLPGQLMEVDVIAVTD